jgi:hypothetical protein
VLALGVVGPTTTVPDVRELLKPNATADVLAADLDSAFFRSRVSVVR